MPRGGSRDHESHEVVRGEKGKQFFSRHRGRKAPELLHPHRRFDIPEAEFDAPSAQVEFRQFFSGIKAMVKEGRDDPDFLGSEAVSLQIQK